MVDKKIVEYVANLARVKITEEEKEFLRTQLSKIIAYIDKLKELDVKDIEPMRGFHLENNIYRDDKVENIFDKKSILENAPLLEEDYFKIPKVIE